MKRTIAIAATAAFILGGCSAKVATEQTAGQISTPVPSATPTATPTPTKVTPTPLSIAQAAKVYLAAVTPRNKAAEKWNEDRRVGASAKTYRADAVRGREAERHFLEVLDNTLWPAKVAKNAASLSACTADAVSWFESMSTIKSLSEITGGPTCGGSDAQLIRARLHLPSKTS